MSLIFMALQYSFSNRKHASTLTRVTVRARKPKNATPAVGTAPEWKTGEAPRDGRYLCRVDLGLQSLHEQTCEYKNGEWICYGRPVKEVGSVVSWWPLPERG